MTDCKEPDPMGAKQPRIGSTLLLFYFYLKVNLLRHTFLRRSAMFCINISQCRIKDSKLFGIFVSLSILMGSNSGFPKTSLTCVNAPEGSRAANCQTFCFYRGAHTF